jgi:hypothetical protein
MSSGNETKKRRTYWITDTVSSQTRDRALVLNQKGYDVRFFTTLDSLIAELETQRAGVIVVSDEGETKRVERIILTLMSLPEIQGARMILTVTKTDADGDRLKYLAACGSFRDIIPMNMDDHQWVQRFTFATAGRPMHYTQPSGQISLNNISAVTLPARVTAIDGQHLRLESRVRPTAGAILSLTGPLAEAMGAPSLTLKVESTQRSRLLYRFSDAIIASWSVPASAKNHAQLLISNLKAQVRESGPRCRVFVAAQSPALRQAILTKFEDPRFEVSTALQKQSIVDEPRFFTPDIVFIEDQLCIDENSARFEQMMQVLNDSTTVLIFGKHEQVSNLRQRYADRKILSFHKIPKNLAETVLTRFMPAHGGRIEGLADDASHLSADSPYSLAELSFPARLMHIHPHAAGIALPHLVGDFALCRLDSPLLRRILGRNPYIKFTEIYADGRSHRGDFPHLADGYLADLNQNDRQALSQGLIALLSEHLVRFNANAPATMPADTGATRTPELGTHSENGRVVQLPSLAPMAVSSSRGAAVAAYASPSPSPQVVEAPREVAVNAEVEVAASNPIVVPTPVYKTASEFPQKATEPGRSKAGRDDRLEKLAVREETQESIKLHIAPFTEKVEDLGGEVWTGLIEGITSKSFLRFLGYAALVGFVCTVFWALITIVAPNWQRSGDVYSEQLKKFAPHVQKPSNDE